MSAFLIQLDINQSLYIKDPKETTLGKKIIRNSVLLIDRIGFDQFNFKKLAKEISSAEASIYRYFENKQNLFIYLLNWYWEWMSTRIRFNTINIKCPKRRLNLVLDIIVDTANRNMIFDFIDEDILHKIVVREGSKAYQNVMVDELNGEGFFLAYKRLCAMIADIIDEIDPDFPYPTAFASTLIETANNNLYFARHLPRLTDLNGDAEDLNYQVKKMLEYFCANLIADTEINNVNNQMNPNFNQSKSA